MSATPADSPRPALPYADAPASPPTGLLNPRRRPRALSGRTTVVLTGCGKFYITINDMQGDPFEVFAQIGKSGGCVASQSEAIARLISLALRCGIAPDRIIKTGSPMREVIEHYLPKIHQ